MINQHSWVNDPEFQESQFFMVVFQEVYKKFDVTIHTWTMHWHM